MNRIFRFKDFTTRRDPDSLPECWAVCTGEGDEACGAQSDALNDAENVDEWMREHMKNTGHRHFQRTAVDFAELIPTDELAQVTA
ncbi:hypothetical protein OG914_06820 [Streptomyces sp. NBC_00291]|uniref:DUF7848 domain-containing protein n=1 Tax=Streptomyces sp. NBC_00291 TaxID=2975704 RepID=UPI0022527D9F|nr:hypothetical protein [Streptomyces sp. NBC_00291]MCX5153722.1 hypothetical protein [Streptomyces sp. NBC_00291]